MKNSSRYASLFKLDPLNYEALGLWIKKAGYALQIQKYPQIIIKLIGDLSTAGLYADCVSKLPPKKISLPEKYR